MIALDGRSLTLEQFESVVVQGVPCELDPQARAQLLPARQLIDGVFDRGETVYGVNTGFGDLASVSMGLAKALGPEVRVVAVAPGAILGDPAMSTEQEAAARRANLLHRLGGPESVAESVLFAIRNDFLTGTTLTVDGGRSLR